MPVATLADAQIFERDGFTFRPLAVPSRGSQELALWALDVAPGAASVAHTVDREELFVVHAAAAVGHRRRCGPPGGRGRRPRWCRLTRWSPCETRSANPLAPQWSRRRGCGARSTGSPSRRRGRNDPVARGGTGSPRMGAMDTKPVNLTEALASFDDDLQPADRGPHERLRRADRPRQGEHVWHVHDDTDEFFLVLDGQFDVALRDAEGTETTVALRTGRHLRRTQGHRAQAVLARRVDPDVRAVGHLDDRRPARGRDPRPRRQHHRSRADLRGYRCVR